jgi:hypothetical protein
MKLDARALIAPLIAILSLVLVTQRTMDALHRAGLWSGAGHSGVVRNDDPYARLDQAIAHSAAMPATSGTRDPFFYVYAQTAVSHHTTHAHGPVAPPPPPPPVITAIIWDNDPRALIRLNGHEYTVRSGAQFADYRVIAITRDQVTLDQNGAIMVLNRTTKGE